MEIMGNWLLLLISQVCVALVSGTKIPNMLDDKSVIVHLFEWTYRDIADECVFLSEKGYGGVLISPIQESTTEDSGAWYDRFQPVSFKIATSSGNEEDFRKMVRWCNDLGVRVYVEVILNSMASGWEEMQGYGGSVCNPENLDYPAVPFTAEDFNPECYIYNMNDPNEVRNCRYFGLPDLNYTSVNVQDRVKEFLNKLIGMGVAGFRLMGCLYMWPHDLKKIFSELDYLNPEFGFGEAETAYVMCEMKDTGEWTVSKREYVDFSTITEHRYAEELYLGFYRQKPVTELLNWSKKQDLLPSASALVFLDNYEDQHQDVGSNVITFTDPRTYIAATAYMLAHPYGNPGILSSYYFSDMWAGPPQDGEGNILSPGIDERGLCNNQWVCEHRWPEIAAMVEFRKVVKGSRLWNWADNGQSQMAFCRGELGFIAINGEMAANFKVNMKVCVPPGTYCDVISGGKVDGKCLGTTVQVDENRKAQLLITKTAEVPVIAIHIGSKL